MCVRTRMTFGGSKAKESPPSTYVDPSFGVLFSAGAVAGAVSRTATAPLDRLKTIYMALSIVPSWAEKTH